MIFSWFCRDTDFFLERSAYFVVPQISDSLLYFDGKNHGSICVSYFSFQVFSQKLLLSKRIGYTLILFLLMCLVRIYLYCWRFSTSSSARVSFESTFRYHFLSSILFSQDGTFSPACTLKRFPPICFCARYGPEWPYPVYLCSGRDCLAPLASL